MGCLWFCETGSLFCAELGCEFTGGLHSRGKVARRYNRFDRFFAVELVLN